MSASVNVPCCDGAPLHTHLVFLRFLCYLHIHVHSKLRTLASFGSLHGGQMCPVFRNYPVVYILLLFMCTNCQLIEIFACEFAYNGCYVVRTVSSSL